MENTLSFINMLQALCVLRKAHKKTVTEPWNANVMYKTDDNNQIKQSGKI